MSPSKIIQALFVLGDDLAGQALAEGAEPLLLDAARAVEVEADYRLAGWSHPLDAARALLADVRAGRVGYAP